MPTLGIGMLGGLSLKLDGTPVTSVNSPHLQSLLAYLILHRLVPQARSFMAFTFWPDATDAQACNNLRKGLYDLRRALPFADQFLSVNSSTLQWRTEAPYTLDIDDFEHVAAGSDPCTLETGITLYRGDLMPNIYDEWILPERERLHDKLIVMLERLVELQEERQDYRAAIDNAQRLLRYDPLHEPTYRRLIRLHARMGNRASASRVYHTCVTVLKHEFDLEPSTETRKEYAQLLNRQVASTVNPDTPPIETPLAARKAG